MGNAGGRTLAMRIRQIQEGRTGGEAKKEVQIEFIKHIPCGEELIWRRGKDHTLEVPQLEIWCPKCNYKVPEKEIAGRGPYVSYVKGEL